MGYTTSSLTETIQSNHFLKPFKEDSLIPPKHKTYTKKIIYPIDNFVPVLKPKKANKRPPPLILNQDTQKKDEFKNNSNNKNCLESDFNVSEAFENENLSLDSSDFSSNEDEKVEKDFFMNEKSESPIFKYREEKA